MKYSLSELIKFSGSIIKSSCPVDECSEMPLIEPQSAEVRINGKSSSFNRIELGNVDEREFGNGDEIIHLISFSIEVAGVAANISQVAVFFESGHLVDKDSGKLDILCESDSARHVQLQLSDISGRPLRAGSMEQLDNGFTPVVDGKAWFTFHAGFTTTGIVEAGQVNSQVLFHLVYEDSEAV